jgi:hypothetical protein
MSHRLLLLTFASLICTQKGLLAQTTDSLYNLTGIIYDETFYPVAATHVINIHTRQGDVSDTLGIFHLPVHTSDSLLIRNIAFKDTLIAVSSITHNRFIVLRRMAYALLEARIFKWGSSYDDFKEAMVEMPVQQTLGASMGLPTQDPDYVPLEMDEQAVRSAGLLLTSPITFFYQNFNKKAKTARKVFWLEKNREKHEAFESIINAESLAEITGLSGPKLLEFQSFLLERLVCGIHCTELALYEEIFGLWTVFQELDERGMLKSNIQQP